MKGFLSLFGLTSLGIVIENSGGQTEILIILQD